MPYVRINFVDTETGNTPIDSENLNKMDAAIKEHDDKIGTITDLQYEVTETF